MRREGFVPWPAAAARRYEAAGYWRGLPLGHYLWQWAGRYGDRVAITDGENQLSYRELARRADALAENLLALGLRSRDNILVQLPNCWEFAVVLFACLRIGVAPILVLLSHRAHELRYLASLGNVTAIVVPSRWKDFDHSGLATGLAAATGHRCLVLVLDPPPGRESRRAGELAGEDRAGKPQLALRPLLEPAGEAGARRRRLAALAPDPGDVALFVLSGGTTGTPKIIPRTHNDYEYNARRSGEVSGFDAGTVYLVTLPLAHNFPLASPGLLGTLSHGGRAVMVRSPRPEVAFPVIAAERVTNTSLVPAIAARWAEAAAASTHDLTSLRVVQVGGSMLTTAAAASIGPALGCRLQQVYGMAEGLLCYTRLEDPPGVTLSTQGRPMCPDDELKIVGEHGADVPAGRPGELLTRGPYTTRGYFRAAEHNERAFTPDGWYRTGDLVRLDESGNIVVEGRVNLLINRGGEKISAAEVEELLLSLPQVRQAVAIPVPDDVLGERVCACIVLRAGHTMSLEQARAALTERGVARFKLPERLEVIPEFPLTPVGKVDLSALRRAIGHA